MRTRNEEHNDRLDHAVNEVHERLTEEKWQAILHNDAVYDGKFWYAVKTTSIFCRPSCKSKPPNKDNVQIYSSPDQALMGGFRPCKRCKPTGEKLPDEEWIGHVTDYIVRHYKEHLTLELLADTSHSSPFHLQRTFKRISGITPTEYIQDIRIQHAKTLLVQSERKIADIGSQVGMTNTPYFVTLFKQKVGCTPASYRRQHKRGDELNP